MPHIITVQAHGTMFVSSNTRSYTHDLGEAYIYQDLESATDKLVPYTTETVITYDEALACFILET